MKNLKKMVAMAVIPATMLLGGCTYTQVNNDTLTNYVNDHWGAHDYSVRYELLPKSIVGADLHVTQVTASLSDVNNGKVSFTVNGTTTGSNADYTTNSTYKAVISADISLNVAEHSAVVKNPTLVSFSAPEINSFVSASYKSVTKKLILGVFKKKFAEQPVYVFPVNTEMNRVLLSNN